MRFIAERIKADALSLPRHEREEIARILARSVDAEPADGAWASEVAGRVDELRTGRGAMMPGEEFSAEFEEVLSAG
ncbi:MAG TPA: addiction module protein [Longimicrobium sp.]